MAKVKSRGSKVTEVANEVAEDAVVLEESTVKNQPIDEIKEEPKVTEKKPKRQVKVSTDEGEIKNDKQGQTVEIEVDEVKKSEKPESVKISFMNTDFSKRDQQRTKQSTAAVEGENNNNEEQKFTEQKKSQTIDEVREDIKREEETRQKEMSLQDYENIASFIINVIDWLLSGLLKWIAKDSSDTAYSANTQKKESLTKQLALIMVKYNRKWSIEMMFVISIIGVYSMPTAAAIKKRKEYNRIKKEGGNAESIKRKPGRPKEG